MTERQIELAKRLRKKIVIFAKNDLRITMDELHSQMQTLGYGSSLRELNLPSLVNLNLIIRGKQNYIYEKLDPQGKKIWALYKSSNWSKDQLYAFIAQKFNKSGIKYLTKNEKGTLIKVLQSYELKRI